MENTDLKDRTMRFALAIIRLVEGLPYSQANRNIGGQLIRSAASVAANYRAARRGKSRQDFLYKIKVVEEEADESVLWLEMLAETNYPRLIGLEQLTKEAFELTAIFSASAKTLKFGKPS